MYVLCIVSPPSTELKGYVIKPLQLFESEEKADEALSVFKPFYDDICETLRVVAVENINEVFR